MSDEAYKEQNFVFSSKGVVAHPVEDTVESGHLLNEMNIEEVEENGLATRLGTTIISKKEGIARPLGGTTGIVHSLAKLTGLNGSSWRYAGMGSGLYRLAGTGEGEYTKLSGSLSGQPWSAVAFQCLASSYPTLFIADAAGMLKDNGTGSAPQQMGIFQPQYPCTAQSQKPDLIVLDDFVTASSSYAQSDITSIANGTYVNTTLATAVTTVGIREVTYDIDTAVTDNNTISLFQHLTIDTGDQEEEVLVILLTKTGFVADFTKTHAVGATVTNADLSVLVPVSVTATVGASFADLPAGAKPISAWPTTLEQADYIGLYLYVSDPTNVQSITLKFDCGDGTFNSDYFYKVIAQGPLQSLLDLASSSSTAATTAAEDALLNESLGLYGNSAGSIVQLSTGTNNWNSLLVQLSDFAGSGSASFDDAIYNWSNVNGYQLSIVMNDTSTATIKFSSLILFGGYGADSFAGVSYDYMFTFFNNVDYTESNPCMAQSDVNPPYLTNRVLPRRQPVLVTMNHPKVDPQTTSLRVYRRGGTMGDMYRRLDTIPCTGTKTVYTDIWEDAEIHNNDEISFTNDVPVTSSLPTPVNTTLTADIGTYESPVNAVITIAPASMDNISVSQQVDIGDVSSSTFEVVIVLSVTGTTFDAFVQNYHAAGETVAATAKYGQPVTIMAVANDMGFFAGDVYNPSYLYNSAKSNIQSVSSAAYVPVSTPSDAITAIVSSHGNLFVSTIQRWFSAAPGSQAGSSTTIYPTAADHGVVAKNAWCLRDGVVFYLGTDGLRTFTGGNGGYISELIEAIWQNTSTTPMPIADQTKFSTVVVETWNRWVFFAYTALDRNRYRIVLDVTNKRYRIDTIDAQSMLLEVDTNHLVWGDSQGLVHLDRQLVSYDETSQNGVVIQSPIAINVQSPYANMGMPAVQKQLQEYTLDANTNGIPVTCELLLDDGQSSVVLGTVTTTERKRVNLNINAGDGVAAYKVSLLLTGSGSKRINLYQAKVKYLPLAMTRKSLDTFWLKFGSAESKYVKQIYVDYQCGADITVNFYYDSDTTPGYVYTLPHYGGVRNSMRVRLPAISVRLFRIVMESPQDFQIWPDSRIEYKMIAQGKGASVAIIAQ